ncbi:MAG: hypothetical protein HC824_00020 [Synechococcales cyanobacterium RM1_1_8]|nr:hypothetical protein [Synechococcales cyanobacterium RM1_1_8]
MMNFSDFPSCLGFLHCPAIAPPIPTRPTRLTRPTRPTFSKTALAKTALGSLSGTCWPWA